MRFNEISWRKILSYVLVAVVTAAIAFPLGMAKNPDINYSSSGTIVDTTDKLDMIQAIINANYIGDIDTNTMIEAAAAALVESTGDQWSFYMSAEEYKLYQEQSANEYDGIGATVDAEKVNGGFRIKSLDPGSGGEKAGLQVGDIITYVGDRQVADMNLQDVRSLIRGKKGSQVKLTVNRNGESLVLLVTRGTITVDVAKGQMLDNGIAMITIANFDDRCSEETINTIEELINQGAKALLFDVRNNPGGYKHELVDLLDYLLPSGVLFTSETYDGEKTQDSSDAKCLELPMAVLVNKDSYSAAEFFAAALEEYDWAIIVGEHTTGKGYFQTNIDLPDGSAVHLSVGKYYTPKGVSLAETQGIAPAVEIELTENETEQLSLGRLTPENDPQVQAAVTALLEKLG